MNEEQELVASLLALPPQMFALLDWCSGIVRVNATQEQYELLRRNADHPDEMTEDEVAIMEVLSHECFHFLQICTTGYLYQLAIELMQEFGSLLPRNAKDALQAIQEVPRLLSQSGGSRLKSIVESIDVPGRDGVTVRAIVESHAFFAQKLHHYRNLSAPHYKQMLNSVPGPDYRAAYDFVEAQLGEDYAFSMFSLLASLALCTAAPQDTFGNFCRAAAHEKLNVKTVADPVQLIERLMKHAKGGFYGSAERLTREWNRTHYVYTPAVRRLHGLPSADFTLPVFYANPDSLTVRVYTEVSPLIVFNPPSNNPFSISMRVPAGLWPDGRLENFQAEGERVALLWMMGTRVLSLL